MFFSKYGLLLLSIVLFLFSFLFSRLHTQKSSITRDIKLAEKYIVRQEKDFARLLYDTSLLRRLATQKETLPEFDHLAEKPYGTFIYTASDLGSVYMKFWSDQLAVPPPELFAAEDGDYFHHLSN